MFNVFFHRFTTAWHVTAEPFPLKGTIDGFDLRPIKTDDPLSVIKRALGRKWSAPQTKINEEDERKHFSLMMIKEGFDAIDYIFQPSVDREGKKIYIITSHARKR